MLLFWATLRIIFWVRVDSGEEGLFPSFWQQIQLMTRRKANSFVKDLIFGHERIVKLISFILLN